MSKQKKYFFIIMLLFPLIFLSSWLFGPGSLGFKLVFYSWAFIFACHWLWNASYIIRKNSDLAKKINSKKREK